LHGIGSAAVAKPIKAIRVPQIAFRHVATPAAALAASIFFFLPLVR
jgi:hypothetical protein